MTGRRGRTGAAAAWCAQAALAGIAACGTGGPRQPSPAPPQPAGAPGYAARDDACVASLPDSAFTARDTVFVRASVPDTAAPSSVQEASRLGQLVGYELRAMLGGGAASLPAGEPAISWRNRLDGLLLVIVRRDGTARWLEAPAGSADTVPVRLLEGAMTRVTAHGPALTWARGGGPDSIVMVLSLESLRGRSPSPEGGHGIGYHVFILRAPLESRPAMRSHAPLRWPPLPPGLGVHAHIALEAIIDTTGRVERNSVHDLWPRGVPRYEGIRREEYDRFVTSARATLLGARFEPGRIGPCAVRVRVQIPFDFTAPGN